MQLSIKINLTADDEATINSDVLNKDSDKILDSEDSSGEVVIIITVNIKNLS